MFELRSGFHGQGQLEKLSREVMFIELRPEKEGINQLEFTHAIELAPIEKISR
jgi:hypothetical protein